MEEGQDEESAGAICHTIEERAEKGMLYKSADDEIEILKSDGNDLIVGGPASWDIVDPAKDWVTPQGMHKFLAKFFKMAPEHRNISIDHESIIIGRALLKYPEENPRYFSHVHEKGMFLLAKIRDDGFGWVQDYRNAILSKDYKMFSIRGRAIGATKTLKDGVEVRKIDDIDPIEVGIVKRGMCPMPNIEVLKEKPVKKIDDIVLTKLNDLSKMTWEECIAEASKDPDVSDPEKLCGWLKAHGPNAKSVEPARDPDLRLKAEEIFKKHFPTYGDEKK